MLLHFFFPGAVYPQDVLAVDFFDDPKEWERIRGELPKSLEGVTDKVNAEIAHLSYTRLDKDRPTRWVIEAIHGPLNALVLQFVKHAPPDRLHPDWHGAAPDVGRPVPSPVALIFSDGTVTSVNTPSINSGVVRDKS